MSQQSHLELFFARLWRDLPGERPAFVQQHRFAEGRKFAFDFAWPAPYLVAVELEGGTWIGGRHTRGAGHVNDMEKFTHAAAMGWRILYVTPRELGREKIVKLLMQALTQPAPQ